MSLRRFARQLALPEVGQRGQAAILSHRFAVSPRVPELTRSVATLYAEGAGFETCAEETKDAAPDLETGAFGSALGVFRHAASREVAAGALLVLSEIRTLLAIER